MEGILSGRYKRYQSFFWLHLHLFSRTAASFLGSGLRWCSRQLLQLFDGSWLIFLYLFPFLRACRVILWNGASVKIGKIKLWYKPEIIFVECVFMCYFCDDIYNTLFVTMPFHHLININLPLREEGKNIKKRQMKTYHRFCFNWSSLVQISLSISYKNNSL